MGLLSPRGRDPKRPFSLGFLLPFVFILFGCTEPPLPSEMDLAETMSHKLWKAKAHLYAPQDYQSFETTLRSIRDDLRKERTRFVWFRDYESIAERLRTLLKEGEAIHKKAQKLREAKKAELTRQHSELTARVAHLERQTLTFNEGRLARRALTNASLTLKEASLLIEREDFDGAASKLVMASGSIRVSEEVLSSILCRYNNKALLEKWRRWVKAVISESAERGTAAIVVSKLDRILTLYQCGTPFKSYRVGIGRNGLSDKQSAGDGATPEGRYKVIKKLSKSRYHKALLINYPNDEDRREFLRLKGAGLLSEGAAMGGMIEIHGGGNDGMTHGCISLENRQMDELFELTPLGTPVVIVGRDLHRVGPVLPGKRADDE